MIGEKLIKKSVSKEYRTKLAILIGIVLAVLAVAAIADPAAARAYVCTAGAKPICFQM